MNQRRKSTSPRINKRITALQVRLVDSSGVQQGIVPIQRALALAREVQLDLVEVAPQAAPPVCRIIDYKKLKFEQSKKEKQKKKPQASSKVKGVRFKLNISSNDIQVKSQQTREFLRRGNRVKISCLFRGREMSHCQLGSELLNRICNDLSDVSSLEMPMRMVGRNLTLLLAPSTKGTKRANHENSKSDQQTVLSNKEGKATPLPSRPSTQTSQEIG